MSQETTTQDFPTLSIGTRSRIDSTRLADSFGLLSDAFRSGSRTASDASLLSSRRSGPFTCGARCVRQEYANAISGLRNLMRWIVTLVLVAVAVSVAGGALLQVTPYAGLISLAGIAGLFGLLVKAWQLARDQAMLELIPARYAVAIETCGTQEDARKLIGVFLAETSTLQGGKKRRQN